MQTHTHNSVIVLVPLSCCTPSPALLTGSPTSGRSWVPDSTGHLKELNFQGLGLRQVHTLGFSSWWPDWVDLSLEMFHLLAWSVRLSRDSLPNAASLRTDHATPHCTPFPKGGRAQWPPTTAAVISDALQPFQSPWGSLRTHPSREDVSVPISKMGTVRLRGFKCCDQVFAASRWPGRASAGLRCSRRLQNAGAPARTNGDDSVLTRQEVQGKAWPGIPVVAAVPSPGVIVLRHPS